MIANSETKDARAAIVVYVDSVGAQDMIEHILDGSLSQYRPSLTVGASIHGVRIPMLDSKGALVPDSILPEDLGPAMITLRIVEELGGATIAMYLSRLNQAEGHTEYLQLGKDPTWQSGVRGVIIEPVQRLSTAEAEPLLTVLRDLFGEKPEPASEALAGTVCRRQWTLGLGSFEIRDIWERPA